MTAERSSIQLDEELETARALLSSITALVDEAMVHAEGWLRANDQMHGVQSAVMRLHADKLRTHAATMVQRTIELGSPFLGPLLAKEDFSSIRNPPEKVIETRDAYDQDKLNSLCARDIQDAIEFNTEFKDTFGFSWIDEEVRTPLTDALQKLLDMSEDCCATVPGIVVTVLKVLVKGHPRGFGRYYPGVDPWPRASSIVQVEIDTEMPEALRWIRFELEEALEQEAALANSANGDDDEGRV